MKLGMDIYQLITDFSVDIHYVVALILSGCAVTYVFTKIFHKGHAGSIEDSIDFLEKVREQTVQAKQQIVDLNVVHHKCLEEKNQKIVELEALLASKDNSTSIWGFSQTTAPPTAAAATSVSSTSVSPCVKCNELQTLVDDQKKQLKITQERVDVVTVDLEVLQKLQDSSITDERVKLLNEELALKKIQLTKQSTELEELYDVITGLEEETKASQAEVSRVTSELTNTQNAAAADQDVITTLKLDKNDSATKIENFELEMKNLADEKGLIDAEVVRLKDEVFSLRHDLEVVADRNRVVEKELDIMKEEQMGHLEEHNNLNDEHSRLNFDHDQLQAKLDEANKLLKEQESTMEEQEETMEGLQEEIEDLKRILEGAGLESASQEIKENSSDGVTTQKMDDAHIMELEKDLETLNETNTTLSTEIDNCQKIASEQNDKIFNLTKELDGLKSEVLSMKKHEEELHRTEKELQMKCETLENSLELERAAIHGIDSDHKGEIEDLQKIIEDLQNKSSKLDDGHKEKDALLNSQIKTMEEQEDVMAQLQAELEHLKAEHSGDKEGSSKLVAQLSDQVESLNTAVSLLTAALKEREETCAQLQLELNEAIDTNEKVNQVNQQCAVSFANEKLVMEETIMRLESQHSTADANDDKEQSLSTLVISSDSSGHEEGVPLHDEEKPSSDESSPDRLTKKEELPPTSPVTKSGWFNRLISEATDNNIDVAPVKASSTTSTTTPATTTNSTTTTSSSSVITCDEEATALVESISSFSDDHRDIKEVHSADYEEARKPRIQNYVVQSPKEKKTKTVETMVKKVKEESASAKVPIGWTNAGKLNRAAVRIQKHFRGLLASKSMHEKKAGVPHSVVIEVVRAEEIALNDDLLASSPDTFVVATVARTRPNGKQYCFSAGKTDIVRGDVNPVYNQEISPSAFGTDYKLVFNVFSSHTLSADSLKGQAILNVHSYNHLDNGKKHKFRLQLRSPTEIVYDASGNELEKVHISTKVSGELELHLSIPPIHRSCNGWFFKINKSIIGNVSGKKIWAVLREDCILCYDDPFCQKLYFVLNLQEAIKIAPKSFFLEKIETTGIEITMKGTESVYLAWGDDSNTIKGLWFQALKRFNEAATEMG